mgnify:CR=1 FL=1|eukprot:scaffold2848_cov30-Tisochrysis_lutea.AAC.3
MRLVRGITKLAVGSCASVYLRCVRDAYDCLPVNEALTICLVGHGRVDDRLYEKTGEEAKEKERKDLKEQGETLAQGARPDRWRRARACDVPRVVAASYAALARCPHDVRSLTDSKFDRSQKLPVGKSCSINTTGIRIK